MKRYQRLSCVTAIAALCCNEPARAQFVLNYDQYYHTSYTYQGGTFNTRCMAPLSNGGNVMVSSQSGWPTSFMLSVVDNAGNVTLNKIVDPPVSPSGYFAVGMHSVITCEDDGFLVAGYSVNGNDFGISAVKLDPSGNVMWAKFYAIATNNATFVVGGFTIVKVKPNANVHDSYVFVCTGPSPAGINNDSEPYALKVDHTGNLIWSRQYIDANRTILPFLNVTHHAYSAVYVPAKGEVVIAGQRNDVTATSDDYQLFIFSIDEVSGHPAQTYKTYKMPGYPYEGRAVNDGSHILLSFTNGNTNGFNGRAASTIGLMKFDYNLNLVAEKQYIKDIPQQAENYVSGLTWSPYQDPEATKEETAYVLSGKNTKIISGGWTPFIFKVNSATLLPFTQRSMSGEAKSVDHTQTINPYSGNEEYNIVSDYRQPNSTLDYIKVTKFDQNLDNCNAADVGISYAAMNPRERYKTQYLGVQNAGDYDLVMASSDQDLSAIGCKREDRRPGAALSVSGIDQEGHAALQLYPNIQKAHEAGNIMIAAQETTAGSPVQLRMLDGNGRVVLQKEVRLNGTTAISCPLPALVPGLYILRVTGASGALLGTFKLTVF